MLAQALLPALALLGSSRGPLAQDVEQEAAAALAAAEALVPKAQYERAAAAYEKLAERWPDTRAGRAALRRTAPNAYLGWADVLRHGPSANRVDVVLMGDGYLLKKQKVFEDVAKDVPPLFEQDPIFEEYFSYLTFVRAHVASEEDGIDGFGREASTALHARVLESSTIGQVVVDPEAVRNVLDEMPAHDGVAIVFVPRGTGATAGPGVASVGGKQLLQVVRAFAQAFAGLHDETDVDDGLSRGPTPNEKNVANTEDPDEVPWKHFLEAKVPGVGVYRGGYGRLDGSWRPTPGNCAMGTGEFFCPVCREAIVLAILDLVDPIDGCEPAPAQPLTGAEPHRLRVTAMRPASHVLEARWWVLPEAEAPAAPAVEHARRTDRGPLAPIAAKPLEESLHDRKGEHELTVDPAKLAPGRYRVICRVRDTTQPRGERFPWVLRDERGLLESERSWSLVVE